MKKQHVELINYLCNHKNPITSKELSNALNVSIRSIKNYVNSLNILANEQMIVSSNNGYTIHKIIAAKLLENEETQIPQTSEERSFYIIKQLLVMHSSHLDLFELCDLLFVSYSTLKNDISKMNKGFSNFHVEFVIENDTIRILGSEKNKRKLVSYVIYEETNNRFMNSDIIKESFDTLPIDRINLTIHSIFEKYNYYINEFANINLLLHFAIIIDRIKDGNYVNIQNEDFVIENENERALVSDLCNAFEEEFSITFNNSERYEIYMLFKTNANYSLPSSQETLRKIVGSEIIEQALHIVEKVNDFYYINLDNENFLTPFALHLKNLVLRAQNQTYTKNPMTQSIKTSCPTVYDIAIYISLELMEHYNIHINEDEVTFLALHVGAEIERQKTNDSKLKCVLFCPDYMKISTQIYNQLLIEFGNQIDIIKTITVEEDLKKYSFDFCLTVIKLHEKIYQDVLLIPPFLQAHDKAEIYNLITKISNNRKNQILKHQFHQFFSEELFLENPEFDTKEEVLHMMTEKLVDLNLVDESFEEKVLTRENAAATAFGNIAIPHAMKMEALKTCISLCVSKKGIRWGTQSVNVILLVAINKADKSIFHELYEALVALFSKEEVVNQVKECTTFQNFKNLVFEYINMDVEE